MNYDPCNTCMLLWDLKADECAAWVQAWGSIAAIAVGAMVVRWQAQQQRIESRRIETRATIQTLGDFFDLLDITDKWLSGVIAKIDLGKYQEYMEKDYDGDGHHLLLQEFEEMKSRILSSTELRISFKAARYAFIDATDSVSRDWQSSKRTALTKQMVVDRREELIRLQEKFRIELGRFELRITELRSSK